MELEDARCRKQPAQVEIDEVNIRQELRERAGELHGRDVSVLGQNLRSAKSENEKTKTNINVKAKENTTAKTKNESENGIENENENGIENESEVEKSIKAKLIIKKLKTKADMKNTYTRKGKGKRKQTCEQQGGLGGGGFILCNEVLNMQNCCDTMTICCTRR